MFEFAINSSTTFSCGVKDLDVIPVTIDLIPLVDTGGSVIVQLSILMTALSFVNLVRVNKSFPHSSA